MPKKAKKDAKEQGSIAATVKKHAAGQFTNSVSSMPPRVFHSDDSSSSVQSPEIKPVATPSSNGNPTSPMLDAISSASFATSNTPSMANEWTNSRGVPGIAGSPGNLVSLMGESPPTQPSSYEDTKGWASPRSYSTNNHASASPPSSLLTNRRPMSYHLDAQYQSSEAPSYLTPAGIRRSSLHSHHALSRTGPNPPLPHEPQAHYFGVTDLGFDSQPLQQGMKAGDRGYHFAFDKIPTFAADGAPGRNHVVTAGYEGGLEVYSVGKRGLESIAGLKGLRGGVLQAAILPWATGGEGHDQSPLVALVLHGPVLAPKSPDMAAAAIGTGLGDERQGGTGKSASPVDCYQTSVEVYSLKTNRRVATLLEAPKIPITASVTSEMFRPPPPSGAFHIKADGGNLVISSGVTGESWVYRYDPTDNQEVAARFWCVGKLWTALQQPPKGDAVQDTERSRTSVQKSNARSPIIAINGRWIAYCPAAPSSQMSLRATVPVAIQGRAPGLATVTPPQLPSVTSDVDLPISDSLVNKIMRDATQEFIHGARWVGKQGWQAFNTYWKGPQNSMQGSRSPPLSPQSWSNGAYGGRPEPSQFPPTHGVAAPAVSKEPGIISIVDVSAMGSSTAVHPLATFSPPFGCSFLSFHPTGLALFTASSKGDVQTVWDLMRVQHTKSSPLQPSAGNAAQNGSRIRQIAQFSRLTVARIVDVSWAKPHGQRAAMITERGTVHLLDMPSTVFTWPPPRRRIPPQDPSVTAAEGKHPAMSMATSAFSTALGVARPLMTRPRRSSSTTQHLTGSSLVDHASHGGKAIVATISNSLGKTGSAISQLRHTGENRTTLPLSAVPPSAGCAVWIAGPRSSSLYVLGDGLVRSFPNRARKTASGTDSNRTPCLTRHRDYKLPGLPGDKVSLAVKRYIDPDEYLDLVDESLETGNHTLVLENNRRGSSHKHGAESTIPEAEIESSAPYQPFHTDRRVALYSNEQLHQSRGGLSVDHLSNLLVDTSLEERPAGSMRRKHALHQKAQDSTTKPRMQTTPWVFGQTLPATRLDTGHIQASDEELLNPSLEETRALPASAIERVLEHGEDDNQIVITTRRRRGGGRAMDGDDDEDGFFEDDCEVLDFADQRV
ncbi:hypothetical protein ACKVWC_003930 [Pyricularia oryzae]